MAEPIVYKLVIWPASFESSAIGLQSIAGNQEAIIDPRIAVISHLIYPEETKVIVYRNTQERFGKTRHYQDEKYFGKDDNGAFRSKLYETSVTRCKNDSMVENIFEYLTKGIVPNN